MLIDNAHGLLCLDEAGVMRADLKGQRIPVLALETLEPALSAKSLTMSVRILDGTRPMRLKLDSGSKQRHHGS